MSLPYIDCETRASGQATVAAVMEMREPEFCAWLDALDVEAAYASDSPPQGTPDLFFESQPAVANARMGGVYWFHCTRVRDPDCFMREGIVPLLDGADRIYAFLRGLAGHRVTDAEWAGLREGANASAFPYCHRRGFADGVDHGPLAWLIREMALVSRTGQTDILRDGPEAMQDICQGIEACGGPALYREALAGTVPCIVKFRTDTPDYEVLGGLLYYLWSARRGDELIDCTCGLLTHDARGRTVPPEQIVYVEAVDL